MKVWANGALVAHFIKHVSGSNITFTKGKKRTQKQIHLLRNGGKRHFEKKATFIKYMVSRAIAFKIV